MQYDVRTPVEYLEALEDDWRREKLLELRSIIMEYGPELTEEIQYKMLSYRDERGPVFGLNAQKHYVSLCRSCGEDRSRRQFAQRFECGKGLHPVFEIEADRRHPHPGVRSACAGHASARRGYRLLESAQAAAYALGSWATSRATQARACRPSSVSASAAGTFTLPRVWTKPCTS